MNQDGSQDNIPEKVRKNAAGEFINPMACYGEWHNECVKRILEASELHPDKSFDELWAAFGEPYMASVLGANYIPSSLPDLKKFLAETQSIMESKSYVSMVSQAVANGKINPNFSTSCITRNNYEILLELHSFLANNDITTPVKFAELGEILHDAEQEMVSNYYQLIDNGVISAGDAAFKEYQDWLVVISISISSHGLWSGEDRGIGVRNCTAAWFRDYRAAWQSELVGCTPGETTANASCASALI